MQLTVTLVSEESVGVRALETVLDRRHRVACVFTRIDGTARTASLVRRARSLDIPVRDATEIRDPSTAEVLRADGVELLLNIHSMSIVDAAVLEAPSLGAYNLHPGPLPERAGLHAPSWALYEGADVHGVTLHRMTTEVDAGDVAFADRFPIGPADTALSVMTECIRRGLRLVAQLLECAERGEKIPSRRQELSRRRWLSCGPPDGGRVDWYRPARRIADFVRACDYRPFESPWGFPRCLAGEQEMSILTAQAVSIPSGERPGTVTHTHDGGIRVAATGGWVHVGKVAVDGEAIRAADAIDEGTCLR